MNRKTFVPTTESDYLIVGSGAAGSTVALELAKKNKQVTVIEEGAWIKTSEFKSDLYSSMKNLFRDFGIQVARGKNMMPVMQGCCVGGTTVMSGSIMHRLPQNIYQEWSHKDPGFGDAISYSSLEENAKNLEQTLGVKKNIDPVLKKLPVAQSLEKLKWRYSAMARSAPGCQASGRCLQGCPSGGKHSMDVSFIPRAIDLGANVLSEHRVQRLLLENGRAVGVEVQTADGKSEMIYARKAVILAAGAVQSPLILLRSGLNSKSALIGANFQCHLSAGMIAVMERNVEELEGPPQGVEVFEFDNEDIKLATQLLPPELLLARVPVVGRELVTLLENQKKISSWTVSIRSKAMGSLTPGRFGASIRFEPTLLDMQRLRYGLWRIAQLQFAMGASRVFPGIFGLPVELRDSDEADLILDASLDPRSYFLGAGHLFGTCQMGSQSNSSVVDLDFKVHGITGLYIVDASVFPTNIGVNPQLSIMSMAMEAGKKLALL